MAARQGPGGGGGLWTPPPCPALESLLAGSLFPDELSQAAAVPSFFGSSPTQLPSPPPLSATALLGHPQDNFDMFREQDLEQLTAQVAHSKYRILKQADNSSSFSLATSAMTSQHVSSSVIVASMQEMPTLPSHTDNINTESTGVLQVLQSSSITLDRPADDGYNWRKYGQKAVKGGEYPRSYYKCTHRNCLVRKNVEHSADGRIIQITYRGQHSHGHPSKRRFRDHGGLSNELDYFNDKEDASTRSQSVFLDCYGKPVASNGSMASRLMARREEGDEQLYGSCDSQEEDDDEVRTDDGAPGDANANERNAPAPGQKIIVSTTSEVDLLDDGYKWRKYGQKVVKGNPHPRSYYKCTYQGCDVKKHIERSSEEPNAVITTYEGKHIHDVPATRNRRHATANTSPLQSTTSNSQPYCT